MKLLFSMFVFLGPCVQGDSLFSSTQLTEISVLSFSFFLFFLSFFSFSVLCKFFIIGQVFTCINVIMYMNVMLSKFREKSSKVYTHCYYANITGKAHQDKWSMALKLQSGAIKPQQERVQQLAIKEHQSSLKVKNNEENMTEILHSCLFDFFFFLISLLHRFVLFLVDPFS